MRVETPFGASSATALIRYEFSRWGSSPPTGGMENPEALAKRIRSAARSCKALSSAGPGRAEPPAARNISRPCRRGLDTTEAAWKLGYSADSGVPQPLARSRSSILWRSDASSLRTIGSRSSFHTASTRSRRDRTIPGRSAHRLARFRPVASVGRTEQPQAGGARMVLRSPPAEGNLEQVPWNRGLRVGEARPRATE